MSSRSVPQPKQPPLPRGRPPSPEADDQQASGERVRPDLDAWLDYLTLEEQVGQLFWTGLPGPELDPGTERLIREGLVGGFVFFSRQGSDPDRLRTLTDRMQQAARERERHTPGLLIAVDHEGGLVQRFGPPFTAWPGHMALGATRSVAHAEAAAEAMARELRAVGIHLNLAPVADVNNNPANPVIGVRSFGEDPRLVGRMTAAMVRGFHAGGLGAVAKHFPGHGDTDQDSHQALPVVPHARERLNRVELPPFRAAIEAGVDVIMTAHVLFPAVATDGLPATLSPAVLQGMLREELGFEGVVVTDALDGMKAITDHFGLEQGLVMALQAGADAALVPDSFDVLPELHALVVRSVREGVIPRERLQEAVRRILRLKAGMGLLPPHPNAADEAAASARLSDPPLEVVGASAHRELARTIGAEALTVVRNRHLPLRLRPDQPILVVGPSYSAGLPTPGDVSTALGAGVKAYHPNVVEVTLPRSPGLADADRVREAARGAAAIIYGVYNGHRYPAHQALIRELIAAGRPVIVVGLGEPYELLRIPELETYVAAYGYQPPNLYGVGALIFGQAQPVGKLPVTIPGLYPAGHGLSELKASP